MSKKNTIQERHRSDHRMIQKFEIWGRLPEKQKGETKVAVLF